MFLNNSLPLVKFCSSEEVYPVSCTLFACSVFVCSIHFAFSTSLISLQAETVGVCKFNPPLVSLKCNHSASLLLILPWTFSLYALLVALPAFLPSCLSMWPAFHYNSARWQQRAQYWLQLASHLSQHSFTSADCLIKLLSECFSLNVCKDYHQTAVGYRSVHTVTELKSHEFNRIKVHSTRKKKNNSTFPRFGWGWSHFNSFVTRGHINTTCMSVVAATNVSCHLCFLGHKKLFS